MSNHAKFFKDILTKKIRLGNFETVALTQEYSRMLQSKIPQKMNDRGSFTIPFFNNGKAVSMNISLIMILIITNLIKID